jgi:hypothetical protein
MAEWDESFLDLAEIGLVQENRPGVGLIRSEDH